MDRNKLRIIRTQGPTQAEWEELRPIIEKLYKHENKTEGDVRRILLDQYRFSVTSKMFKQHVRKWKIDKKLKRREMVSAERIARRRKALGKETRFLIRGEILTEAKRHYYFKRRPLTTTELEEFEADPSTPSDLDYATPRNDDQDSLVDDSDRHDNLPILVPRSSLQTITMSTPGQLILGTHNIKRSLSPDVDLSHSNANLLSMIENATHPQQWSVYYDLNPQEAFLRQLNEHVRLTTGGQIPKLERRTKFDTTSILRASGWFDAHLNDAIQAVEKGRANLARSIVRRCANIVAAEVEGYFPDMCVLEMVEVVHFLQLRSAKQLQLDFMYNLYDAVCARLGQFHPLVELLCTATRGYSCSLSATLIPTMLDFLDVHSANDVSLNLLLPLFAFQELRSIDTMPRDLLMHVLPKSDKRCEHCTTAIERSAFTSRQFRTWVARQFITLLNDIWVEPHADQSVLWHSVWRSRVWRYISKYPHMSEKREQLEKMPFKQRFWAVAKLCLELVTRNIEKTFLECNNFFPPMEHVSNLIQQSCRKIGLEEEEILPLCKDMQEKSLFESELHELGQCDDNLCKQVRRSLNYWVGEDLCCV